MLNYLVVKNLAIIEEQEIEFNSGLTVISGETGAGKSIILQALELILGKRASSDLVRSGTDAWEVQASFSLAELEQEQIDLMPDFVDSDELIISRSLNSSGKGKIYINGKLSTLSTLTEITQNLVNICRQGEQVKLLKPEYHLDLIDGYAELGLKAYLEKYKAWSELKTKYQELEKKAEFREERIQELEDSITELSKINLEADTRESLEEKVKKFSNSEEIVTLLAKITELLNSSQGLFANIISLKSLSKDLQKLDPGKSHIEELVLGLDENLSDFDRAIQDYSGGFDFDEASLEDLRTELAEVARLERKYRSNCLGLINILQEAQVELDALISPLALEELKNQLQALEDELLASAEQLSEKRKKAATKLKKEIEQELKELNLNANFIVNFSKKDFSARGMDSVEFLISTNKGEEPRELKKVASGGELSRIMLVLKKILNEKSGVSILIFDEVDTGVSGKVARAVGEKLKSLATDSQVICITHLPQVASLASQHLLVEKESKDRTISLVRSLTKEERIEELARMLSGHKVTEASRSSARELLRC